MIQFALLLALSAQAQDLEPQATAILQKSCLQCHSAATKMGGLVLESRADALRGGTTGAALIPGDASRSLLIEKIRANKMPVGNPLPASDKDTLAKWIDAGARWNAKLTAITRKRAGRDFWSLQPVAVQAPTLPTNTPEAWKQHPIDRYVYAAMAAKKLQPSPEADRRTLIRRATFDVTGLPPTPEEVEAFIADKAPDAYPKLIDRLLASTAYGERWGRHWMDVIRFGESHGYEQNHLRPNAWPFRDYIIRSLNEDKPFDRFITEHLAGDLVGVDAGTGFLVAGPHDTVGNQAEAAKRQQRADDLDDMINATASAFLGLTVNCAKCHDHKFDPIEQRDYYRMAAVFVGAIHTERELATAEEKQRYKAAAEPLEAELRTVTDRMAAIRKEAKPQVEAQRAAILAKYREAPDARLTEETFPPIAARFIKLHIEATSSGAGAALDEVEVWSAARNVALASTGAKVHATSVRRADDDAEAYSDQHLTDGKFDRRWFAASAKPVDIIIELQQLATIEKVSWSRDRMGGFMGRFEGPVPSNYWIEVSSNGQQWKRVASSEGRLPPRDSDREQLLLLTVLNEAARTEYRQLEQRQKSLQKQLQAVPKPPAAYIGKFEAPKEPIYLHKRGNVMDRGDIIAPASLSTLSIAPFALNPDSPESERRMALAKWITDPANPLTPRVIVNRLWQHHFGKGIVATPSDFGFNGERPTHPELLDYLAKRLQEHGWRWKPVHREILLSMTYRQSSAHHAANARIDGDAQLLWRYPPQRLEAEAIRDSILAVSGKLDRTMGGPGFRLYRYTVDNVATYYPLEKFGPETYRRAVYQTAARSVRSEMLGQYDCPDSSLPEPRRFVTTSPLQALALLNNSFLLDQAQHFAQRLEKEATGEQRIDRAFTLAFGRKPDTEERTAASKLIAEHGLAAFCRALLNANEFIYVM
ncbi:MAG: DUF1553 domain-containing protein [Acidobacteria bacterium]|nr:DUF1553 domain-containing protein [Acidobacteriota bacterium]